MEYLYHILGIKVRYLKDLLNPMPNFIVDRYKLQRVLLDDKPAVFVTPKLDFLKSQLQYINASVFFCRDLKSRSSACHLPFSARSPQLSDDFSQ